MDMEPFSRINPCGYAGMPMCQVRDFQPSATVAELESRLVAQLASRLGRERVSHTRDLPDLLMQA